MAVFHFVFSDQTDSQVNSSQRKSANQNLHTDLRWVAKRIRKSARKFTQVAKSRKFHAYTVDLRSTCVDLRWVAKRRKTCVDLRTANLSSTKVSASHRKSTYMKVGGQTKRKPKTCVDLRVRLTTRARPRKSVPKCGKKKNRLDTFHPKFYCDVLS